MEKIMDAIGKLWLKFVEHLQAVIPDFAQGIIGSIFYPSKPLD